MARLTGVVAERGPDWLIVDVNGVGYLVHGPVTTVAGTKIGAEIALHTHLSVREDGMTLYGFASADERRLFQTLIAVSGVGPKVALALLSIMAVDELSYAIASGNAAALSRAPGVGQKLASRIALELRDKLTAEPPVGVAGDSSEVVAALMGLGYTQAEATEAVAKSELPADAPVEDKVRLALSYFGRARGVG
ncbi:MAG: Holliday junction branch migration protein RuvA [Chloroflexi bacterium]|nr:Holliday junction branch migration protein RuvA [Chloroflexota bacterium]